MALIAEAIFSIVLIADTGSGYVPDPGQEQVVIEQSVTPPEKAALLFWEGEGTSTTPNNSSAAQSDTGPRAGVWRELALCESGMNGEPRWDYNGDSGFDGGLQFSPTTWDSFKSGSDPSHAHLATPERQIEVARKVAAAQGAGAWPSCTSRLGITTQQLLNN